MEVAAVPGVYSTVYDSGHGNMFYAATGYTEEFPFPEQLVRYVRTTEYVIPGTGQSYGTLDAVPAFATPAPRVAYFPLSNDTKYFTVNIARRATGDVQPTAPVVYSNGATVYAPNPSQQVLANAIDGDDQSFNWSATSGNLSTATATVTVDLGQVQSLGAIREMYANAPPLSTSLRVAQDLSGPWTTVHVDTPVVVVPSIWPDFTTSFDAVSARYFELTMKGTTSVAAVNLIELLAYLSSITDPAPSSTSHLDLTYLTGASTKLNANMGQSGGPRIHYSAPGRSVTTSRLPLEVGREMPRLRSISANCTQSPRSASSSGSTRTGPPAANSKSMTVPAIELPCSTAVTATP